MFIFLYLYLVFVCLFSCTALLVRISQVIGCEDRLRNDLFCVGWGVKLYSLTLSLKMHQKSFGGRALPLPEGGGGLQHSQPYWQDLGVGMIKGRRMEWEV